MITDYAFNILDLHQLYVNVTTDNTKSLSLFTKHDFKKIGEKKDWIFSNGKFKNEILFQLIND